jgi:hypothetical protein
MGTEATYVQQGILNLIEDTIQTHTIFANEDLFPKMSPSEMGFNGSAVKWYIEYASTSNGGLMTDHTDAGPTPDTLSVIEAYKTKDFFQAASILYNILYAQQQGDPKAIDTGDRVLQAAIKNLVADVAEAMASDIVADIDSAGNFSDAALDRATYNLASKEVDVLAGALTLSHLDQVIDALMTKEYGRAQTSELAIICNGVNHRRIAALSTGTQYSSVDSSANMDAGVRYRTASYEGIGIYIEDSLPDTDIIIPKVGAIKIATHWEPIPKDINVDGWQEKTLLGMGKNLIVTNPRHCGKVSGIGS